MNTTLKDVTTFIRSASETEIDALCRVIKDRSKALNNERAEGARALPKGARVELVNISPKRLAGFTGTIVRIDGKAATVKLDAPPLWERSVASDGTIRVHVATLEAVTE